ncbi:MAG: right-handed parallel beta-helix repeat-containing protein, partial [Bacteroidota bacterium]
MKKLTLFALLAAWLAPAIAYAQVDRPIVNYNDEGYKYQFVKSRDGKTGTFYDPGKSDEAIGGWEDPDGQGAWGTLNKPKSDPCPLNIPEQINVKWPSSRDLLIRRWIDESEIGAIQNVRVNVALDNGVIVYWNGQEVGRVLDDDCAEETYPGSGIPKGDKTFEVLPDDLKIEGVPAGSRKHLLAVRGLWLSAKNYLDIEVIADVGFTLTTTVEGPGSLEITPEKDFYFGETVTLKATVDEPSTHFFGRWEEASGDVTIRPGWDGIPLTPEDDPFDNPIQFTVDQNISVTAYFSVLPPRQEAIRVTSNEDYIPDPDGTPDQGDGTLRWAIEQAENYPGPDEIVINVGGTIQLFAPLSTSDVLILNQSGGLVTLEPAPGFGSESSGLALPGVFVNWGYESGGITLSGLQIQKFPGAGICIQSDNNTVEGCIITDNRGHGICIIDGNNNTIGGTADGQGNTIFLNDGNGVAVSEESAEDLIPPPSGNGILGNSIYHNGGLGIDLANRIGEFGISWNRFPDLTPYDRSDYINDAQNFPDLYLASIAGADPANPNSSVVFGSLFGPTGKTYRIEMFRNSTPDENDNIADLLGNGEGEELVGWTETPVSVTEEEDGLGKFTRNAIYNFEIVTTQPLAGGDILSATATDEANNTSEFSTILYTGVITRIYGAMVAENDPHNRWVVNTTFLGIPLHWQDGIAEFSIGLNFPDHFKPQVNDVLSAWNAVQPVPLSFSLAQNLSPTDQWALTPDGKNNLVYAAD